MHALVIIGLVPMATALLAVLRNGERPSPKFWLASSLGAASVFAFGFTQAKLHVVAADGWMLAAVASAAFGYSEGARLTPRLGGWRVISWALVLSLPLTLGLSLWAVTVQPLHAAISWRAWLGLGYVGVVSMYLGFFAWYRGLTRTTIARASQVQLAQPVLGFLWSWLLLGERVTRRHVVHRGFRVGLCGLGQPQPRAPDPGDTPERQPRSERGYRHSAHFLVDSTHLLGHSPAGHDSDD